MSKPSAGAYFIFGGIVRPGTVRPVQTVKLSVVKKTATGDSACKYLNSGESNSEIGVGKKKKDAKGSGLGFRRHSGGNYEGAGGFGQAGIAGGGNNGTCGAPSAGGNPDGGMDFRERQEH